MKIRILILALLFASFTLPPVFSQSRVLGKPEIFERPVDSPTFYNQKVKDRLRAPWIVVCDRANAQTYKEAGGGGGDFKKLKFKDWFYVSDEKEDWIHLIKGAVNSSTLKIEGQAIPYGWINKKDILLWTNGLIDSRTLIHKKAFLLNKASEIKKILELERKEIVRIFSGPNTTKTEGEKTIYEFYFIFKKENNRYLLSKNVGVNAQVNIDDIIGWVEERRVEDWNTRICLEPNFEEDAYDERKKNPNYRVVAYGEDANAKNQAETAKVNQSDAFWVNDPVVVQEDQMAKTNPRRFRGGVVRFPMLSNNTGSAYYRSGVIGDITVKTLSQQLDNINEINYSGILSTVQNKENSRDNYNVLFVVEGTKGMAAYKNSILSSITKVKESLISVPNVRFGAAIYRDTPEKQNNKLFELLKMTSEVQEIKDFFNTVEFNRWYDNDEYTAMKYGLNQALLESGLNSNHTNIVIIIGNSGDYSAYRPRRVQASSANDETLISDEDIIKKLGEVNAHVIAIQCKNANDKESATFVTQTKSLILETAKEQHYLYKGVKDYIPTIDLVNPTMPDEATEEMVELEGGPTVGISIRPKPGINFSERELTNYASQASGQVAQFVGTFWEKIGRIVEDGASIDEISAGELAPAASKLLFEMLSKSDGPGKKGASYTKDDVIKLANDKYKLYAEVFIPKSVKGAVYPTMSYILFMPEDDLDYFIEVLDRLSLSLTREASEVREATYETLVSLMEQYTGNSNLSGKEDLDDLRAVMQGVEKEGLPPSNINTILIKDVLSPRKVSDEEIRKLAYQLTQKASKLKRIQRLGKREEFSYTAEGNTYFWIPLEMTF